MAFTILLLFGYLLGGVPFGLLLGRLVGGVDVRHYGSGNIGATNVNRVLGKKIAAVVLVLDALKGYAPFAIASHIGMSSFQVASVGLASVVGHCFPVALRFRGGKGVATVFGACCALNPMVAALVLLIWLIGVYFSRISAVGALLGALSLPVVTGFFYKNSVYLYMALAMAILVIVRHRENIRQLWERWKGKN